MMAECGLLGMVLGGVPYLASFENMIKVEAALGVGADAIRRLGALGVWVERMPSGSRSGCGLSNAESERLLAIDRWWRVAGCDRLRRPRARFFIGSGRNRSPIACCSPGRARKPERRTPGGARSQACRNAGLRRVFRSKPPTLRGAALPRDQRSGRFCAPPRQRGSRLTFRRMKGRSSSSPTAPRGQDNRPSIAR